MLEILTMCLEFFKTGLFAIGGGLATIPFLSEMSAKYGWFTMEEMTTMLAVSESTPGPIGVNMSTYVGYNSFGILGGLATSLSLVTPSVIVIILIAKIYQKFKDSKIVNAIFTGLRAAVGGLILSAALSIFLNTLLKDGEEFIDKINVPSIILFIVLFVLYKWKNKLHPIVIIGLAGIAGVVFHF